MSNPKHGSPKLDEPVGALQYLIDYCKEHSFPEPVVKRSTIFPWYPMVEISVGDFEARAELIMNTTPIEQRWQKCEDAVALNMLKMLEGIRATALQELEAYCVEEGLHKPMVKRIKHATGYCAAEVYVESFLYLGESIVVSETRELIPIIAPAEALWNDAIDRASGHLMKTLKELEA